MKSRYYCHFVMSVVGIAMGFTLSSVGFTSWGEVHRMFAFDELRLTLTFALAVVVSMLGFAVFSQNIQLAARRFHPGSIPGGILFGAGWALCGACPAIVWVQLGEGRATALISAFGIMAGVFCYPWVHSRFFRWQSQSCTG